MVSLKVENDNYIFTGRSLNSTNEKNKLFEPYDKQILPDGFQIILIHKRPRKFSQYY